MFWTSLLRACLLSVLRSFLHLTTFHHYTKRTTSAAPHPSPAPPMTTPCHAAYDQLAPASVYLSSPSIMLCLLPFYTSRDYFPTSACLDLLSCTWFTPTSCFLLPARVLWPSLPPFRRPPFQISRIHFASPGSCVDTLRPALVFLDCPATLASPPWIAPGELTLHAHLARLARPCCPLPPAPFESVTTTDIARFASRSMCKVGRRRHTPPLPA